MVGEGLNHFVLQHLSRVGVRCVHYADVVHHRSDDTLNLNPVLCGSKAQVFLQLLIKKIINN